MFTFRSAQPEDAQAILTLYRLQVGRPGVTWDASYPDMENIQADLAVHGLYAVIDDYGQIIASAFAGPTDELTHLAWDPRVHRWCDLARICVHPALAGQGIASALLRYLIDQTHEAGFEGMRLLVIPENLPACRLYARMGFVSYGPYEAYGHLFDRRALVYADLPIDNQ